MTDLLTGISEVAKTQWFGKLLMKFVPTDADIEGSTPEEMIKSAAWRAFTISTVSAIPPGALGWLTVLPELIAITKLQMNLVFKIAKYYRQEEKLNTTMVALIFANDVGIEMGKNLVRKYVTEETVLKIGISAGEAG
ncbi:MAG: hypothetical protein Q8M94_21190, partial [Ignavibacteria bacterium]|nr:hypothetical protein [Ignavibacteria bacterium]